MLVKMLNSGVNAFRFNFALYKHDFQVEVLQALREAMDQNPDAKVALMMDTQGMQFKIGPMKEVKTIEVQKGKKMKILNDPLLEGDDEAFSTNCRSLPQVAKVGSIFYINRKLVCEVKEVKPVSFKNLMTGNLLILELCRGGVQEQRPHLRGPHDPFPTARLPEPRPWPADGCTDRG